MDEERFYNTKWEFTFSLRATRKSDFFTVEASDGLFVVRKVVVTTREKGSFIGVSGPKVSGGFETRSKRYRIGGYDYEPAPDWLIDLCAEAGYPVQVITKEVEKNVTAPARGGVLRPEDFRPA